MWSSLRTYLQSVSPDDKGVLNCLRELEGSDPEREVEDLRRQLLEAGMGDAAIDRFLNHLEAFRRVESAAPLASYAGRNETQARSVLWATRSASRIVSLYEAYFPCCCESACARSSQAPSNS